MAVVRFDSMRTMAAGSITGSYAAIGAPLTQNWRMFRITNNTDGDVLISLNGTTDNIFIPAHSFVLYDLATNAQNVRDTDWFVMQINSQFYIKTSTAATTGNIWIEGVYSTGV